MRANITACGRLVAGVWLSSMLSAAHGDWETSRYDEASGNRQHISVTGTAEGWLDAHGHPKLRVSCDSTSSGADLYLGFHFPAEHSFLFQHSRNEPVKFRVIGLEKDGPQRETIEYLYTPQNEQSADKHSVFRTLLSSDGLSSTRRSGKLLLDLQHGHLLDVQFIKHSQPYHIQYSLAGLSELLSEVMQSCEMAAFSYDDLQSTWADYINIAEVAGVLSVQPPEYGAAKPVAILP